MRIRIVAWEQENDRFYDVDRSPDKLSVVIAPREPVKVGRDASPIRGYAYEDCHLFKLVYAATGAELKVPLYIPNEVKDTIEFLKQRGYSYDS